MVATIAVLRGDGIGPELAEAALSVLGACVPLRVKEARIGAEAIDATGDPLPPASLEACQTSDAVLVGAVGGPRGQGALRPEDGLLRLGIGLGLYASLRPTKYMGQPTLLPESLAGRADILVVRDLAGGVTLGAARDGIGPDAVDTLRQSSDQVRRVARVAFRLARRRRQRVTCVDKADVLETSRLWRFVVSEVAREHPDVVLEQRRVEDVSFELLESPDRFDVVLTESLFGDILSGAARAMVGSVGLLPWAALGEGPSVYGPVHGAVSGLAGPGTVNPTGAILSMALLLEHSLGRPDLARVVEAAVLATLRELRTADVGGDATTQQFTAGVHRNLSWLRWAHSPEDQKATSSEWGV